MHVSRILMITAAISALLLSLAALAAAGVQDTGPAALINGSNSSELSATRHPGSKKVVGDFLISISRKQSLKPADTLQFTISVKNISSKTQVLTFPSSQRYDLRVEDKAGRKVWRWSDGKAFGEVLGLINLKPDERLKYVAEWPMVDSEGNKVIPGDYKVFGTITALDLSMEEVWVNVDTKSKSKRAIGSIPIVGGVLRGLLNRFNCL